MPFYPYFNFPFYKRAYNNFNNGYIARDGRVSPNNLHTLNSNFPSVYSQIDKQNVEKHNNINDNQNNNKKNPDNSCLFELFGLKLYFDDILIICLLFFLYNEGVKDESLFIALILLLLS